MKTEQKRYQPVKYLLLTFGLTWVCAFFMAYQNGLSYQTALGAAVLTAVDFVESASPLLAVLLLWRRHLFREGGLVRFVFGRRPRLLPYLIVAFLFVLQFATFYLFRVPEAGKVPLRAFLSAWGSQILLGGGLEEGGWRGYLQPALERKARVVGSVLLVGGIWALWHLPYFFLPGAFQSGGDFIFYTLTATATAFTLTAIYKLTGSVLLCTLFHGWQNAIVMNFPAQMGSPGFLLLFGLQTALSIVLCMASNRLNRSKR